MLDTLITSKTRLKLLLRFFLNSRSSSYLRNLENEFGESTNSIRLELNRFEEAGLLTADLQGNRKVYRANTSHPLFPDIHSLIKKYVGFDQLIDKILNNLGDVHQVYVTGNLAHGIDSSEINLLILAESIDISYLDHLIKKTQNLIKRNIHYKLEPPNTDTNILLAHPEALLIWGKA
jgi:DNA-binding transcriptional ArsR family regulator